MADQRFFKKQGPLTIGQIVQGCGARLDDGVDAALTFHDVSSLRMAGSQDVSFLDNPKYRDDFKTTKAGACFVTPDMAGLAPEGVICLVSDTPYKSYALCAQMFYPDVWSPARVADSAHVSASAILGDSVTIEENVVIGERAEIGDHVWIEAGAVIGAGVKIGSHCRIGANATVSHCLMDEYVRVYPGVRIGQDGFGFAIDPKGHVKVPQLGRVLIGSHVEIGANTTIDRGAGPDTVIGSGTWIDNLVQIGHNVVIGKGCVIVAQVGISGSTVIEDYVAIGGQVGIAGHLRIGKGAQIGAQAGVMADIPAGETHLGSPSFPKTQYFRQLAALNRLIKKKKSD